VLCCNVLGVTGISVGGTICTVEHIFNSKKDSELGSFLQRVIAVSEMMTILSCGQENFPNLSKLETIVTLSVSFCFSCAFSHTMPC